MKKQLIASLVGAVILFLWQFISWAAIPLHKEAYGYTANQDKILESLSQNLTEEGTYFMPNVPPGTSHEEAEAGMKDRMGKPWASVTYHSSMDNNMGMNMTRGFLIDFISAFLLVWLLMKFASLDMQTTVLSCIGVGVIGYLTIPYLHSIWFDENSINYLIDAIVPWGILGLWLGWWLPRP